MSNEIRKFDEGQSSQPHQANGRLVAPGSPAISPSIAEREISFNAVARAYDRAILGSQWESDSYKVSPFLTPEVMQGAIDEHHTRHGWRWSWGGYGENRTQLWRGSYLSCLPGEFLHAGIDMNLPAKSPVLCTRGGIIRVVGDDRDTQGGWGPFVVVETQKDNKKEFVLYGHLGEVLVQPYQRVEPGSMIARTGTPPQNGGWWSHLHIQKIEGQFFLKSQQQGLLDVLDGYFPKRAEPFYAPIYPNPADLIWDPEALPEALRQ